MIVQRFSKSDRFSILLGHCPHPSSDLATSATLPKGEGFRNVNDDRSDHPTQPDHTICRGGSLTLPHPLDADP